METPRVWVGCLGCYNAGSLTGAWFDAEDAPEDMEAFDKALGLDKVEPWEHGEDAAGTPGSEPRTTASQEHGDPVFGPHEELWVMDHENFGPWLTGECSPSEAKRIAEQLTEIADDMTGKEEAFAVFLEVSPPGEHDNDAKTALQAFEDQYMASGDTEFDAAWDYLEETSYFEGLPEHFETHKGAIVRDWLSNAENGGTIIVRRRNGTAYLFTNG